MELTDGKRCGDCGAYHQRHYAANRQRYIDQARERKQAQALTRMRYLLSYFEEHPCADCDETDALVLEFDHLRDKRFNINAALSYRNWRSILDEIAKCEVVCANCHRRRTARRCGSLRSRLVEAET